MPDDPRQGLFVAGLILQAIENHHEREAAHLRERIRIARNSFEAMAEGFIKAREPSKAAACQGMAALMESGL